MPPSGQSKSMQNLIFTVIIAAFLVYASIFISRLVFYVDGKPFTALFDDAMISMTYARNLANGYGLVWNPGGAPVEGYTNPLWVLFMALSHRLPIPENWISLPIQISGLLFLLGSLVILRKIALNSSPGQSRVMLLSVFLTAFYYPLINWSLLGLEVGLLLFWINLSLILMFRILDSGRFSYWLYLLLGIGTLIRMDAAVTYLTIWGLLFIFDKPNRRRHLLAGAFFLALFLGGQSLLRKLYYGEWLPNTYYLKVEGWPLWSRLRRGLLVFIEFARGFFWPLLVVPFTILLFRRDRKMCILILIFLAQVVYSIYVGGDAWEHRGGSNRFISLGMPALFLLFSLACFYWYDLLARRLRGSKPRSEKRRRFYLNIGFTLFLILSVLMWNRLVDNGNPISNLSKPAENSLRYFLLLEPSVYLSGSERTTRDGLIIREVTDPHARVAAIAAGNTCYFAHRECIDMFGKSDPFIAHGGIQVPFDSNWQVLRPGHVKFNYKYSIGQLQPDIVVELVKSTINLGQPYLVNYLAAQVNGHIMYFKKDSALIDFGRLAKYIEPS